jgi:acetyl-CoA carboxylase alpha subunit
VCVCVCVCVCIHGLSNVYYSKTVIPATISFKNARLRQPVLSTIIGEGLPNGAHLFHKLHSVVAAPLSVKTCGSFPPKGQSSVLVAWSAKIALGS